jgi:hypothetical protein
MGSNMMDLKMSEQLRTALQRAASRKLTASEMLEQRVSFVYGSISSKSGVTKERVKQVIVEGVSGATESMSDTV